MAFSARRGFSVAAALMAALVLASAAVAATVAPPPSERVAIIRGFGDPASASSCLVVRLAKSDRRYGEVRPRLSSRCARWAFNGVNVLQRQSDGRWKVLFEGSLYHCPVPRMPRGVQKDLGVCPAG
ncbi:MAG TPA: hypothetical protein VHX66_06645 [Solirubrobacteraceae bacterium]|jgi:hypothetical protein|nr:hypothetical protein [Solirubrobacteraceae bacterium]